MNFSHIKLVQIVRKKSTAKLRIGKDLRAKNKESFSLKCVVVHKYLILYKLVADEIQILFYFISFFSSGVEKRMEITFTTYQDFKEYNISPQNSLFLWPFPIKNIIFFHEDQYQSHRSS